MLINIKLKIHMFYKPKYSLKYINPVFFLKKSKLVQYILKK